MPISMHQLQADTRTIEIPVGDDGDVLTITYRPSAFNYDLEKRENQLRSEGAFMGVMVVSLAALITAWDVVEDGEPLPVSADVLSRFGLPVLQAIRDAILADLLPNLRTVGTSGGSSRRTAKSRA